MRLDSILSEAEALTGHKPKVVLYDYIWEVGDKYLLIEKKDIYQDVEELIEVLKVQSEIVKNKKEIMVIPFYSGINSYDLADFFDVEISEDFRGYRSEINFDLVPANFNIQGLQRFVSHLNTLKDKAPVFRTETTFKDIKEYLANLIVSKYQNQSERVIPKYALEFDSKISGNTINEIFKEVKLKSAQLSPI